MLFDVKPAALPAVDLCGKEVGCQGPLAVPSEQSWRK